MRRAALLFGSAALLLAGCAEVEATKSCLTDAECEKGQLCNFPTGTCYPATVREDLTADTVEGTFRCPYTTTPPTESPTTGSQNMIMELGGKEFVFADGCVFFPLALGLFTQMAFVGHDLFEGEVALVSLVMRGQHYRTDTLKVPSQVWGTISTLKSANQTQQKVAMVWGGTFQLQTSPLDDGEEVFGRLKLKIEPYRYRKFGDVCRLKEKCGLWCSLSTTIDQMSPDCVPWGYCIPYVDGSDKGYCAGRCSKERDCQSVDPDSTCIVECLHTCSSDRDCLPPLECSSGICT